MSDQNWPEPDIDKPAAPTQEAIKHGRDEGEKIALRVLDQALDKIREWLGVKGE